MIFLMLRCNFFRVSTKKGAPFVISLNAQAEGLHFCVVYRNHNVTANTNPSCYKLSIPTADHTSHFTQPVELFTKINSIRILYFRAQLLFRDDDGRRVNRLPT